MFDHPGWRSPLHAIRSRLSAATSAAKFREPAFRIIDALQFHPPEVQIDSLFVTAVSMALVVGLEPNEMVARARRIIPEVDGPFSDQLAAINDYAKGELR